MKKIIALAAMTMFLTSAFMQPAAARIRRGNVYGVMGSDDTVFESQFQLFYTDESGNEILDDAPSDSKKGIFREVIVDYADGEGGLSSDRSTVERAFREDTKEFVIGDLVADLFQFPNYNQEFVRYRIFEEYGTTSQAQTSWILNITDLFTLTNTDYTKPENREKALESAVNDLSYIFEKNLLEATRGVQYVYSTEISNTGLFDIDSIDPFVFGLRDIGDVTIHKVPEPQPINNPASLLTLSVGAYFVFKRRKKQNKTAKNVTI